jgi:hypothetical protein
MRSLTFMATQSMPTVSRRSACSATTIFEPTPSVDTAMPRFGATRRTDA